MSRNRERILPWPSALRSPAGPGEPGASTHSRAALPLPTATCFIYTSSAARNSTPLQFCFLFFPPPPTKQTIQLSLSVNKASLCFDVGFRTNSFHVGNAQAGKVMILWTISLKRVFSHRSHSKSAGQSHLGSTARQGGTYAVAVALHFAVTVAPQDRVWVTSAVYTHLGKTTTVQSALLYHRSTQPIGLMSQKGVNTDHC